MLHVKHNKKNNMKYPKYTTRKRDYSQFEPIQPIEGERIEDKMRRVIDNKEPITDGAPIIYTERKLGVLPAYNIRTDRWEIAQAAMEVNQKAVSAQRAKEYDFFSFFHSLKAFVPYHLNIRMLIVICMV